jgi:hypothetical protein
MEVIMKKAIPILLFVMGLIHPAYSQQWECNDCPRRSVALFDIDNQVPRPLWGENNNLTFGDWIEFFFIAGGINDALMYQDPSQVCIAFDDGQMILALEALNLPEDSLVYQSGVGYGVIPPPGPVLSNYLVYSQITGTDPGYLVTVCLETGKTREPVQSASVVFDPDKSALENGMAAAQTLIPLMGTIRDFERMKRNTTDNMAMRASLEIHPERSSLSANSSTALNIKLTDCDGQPLPGRTVKLDVNTGSLSQSSAVTDEAGEVTVMYTAGGTAGWAEIEVRHEYLLPFGVEALDAVSKTLISIDFDYSGLWEFSATCRSSLTRQADTLWSYSIEGYHFDRERSFYSASDGSAEIRAVFRSEYSNGELCYFWEEPPEVLFSYGDCWGMEKLRNINYVSGEIPIFGGYLVGQVEAGSEKRTDNYSFPVEGGYFEFQYTGELSGFIVGAGGNGLARYNIMRYVIDQWVTFSGDYDTDCSVGGSWFEGDVGGIFTETDSVFNFSYLYEDFTARSEYILGTWMMMHTMEVAGIDGMIRPLSHSINAVDPEIQPPGCRISAYPNPVKHHAVIGYEVPAHQLTEVLITDLCGKQLCSLVHSVHEPGKYSLLLSTETLEAGVYLCLLKSGTSTAVNKLVVIK